MRSGRVLLHLIRSAKIMLSENNATTININRTIQKFTARQTHYQLEDESEIRINGTF